MTHYEELDIKVFTCVSKFIKDTERLLEIYQVEKESIYQDAHITIMIVCMHTIVYVPFEQHLEAHPGKNLC